jgi:hypothetical protein
VAAEFAEGSVNDRIAEELDGVAASKVVAQ